MNKKKWIGAITSTSLIANATQNFALCDDIIGILIKNGFQDLADVADASFRSIIYDIISKKIAEHMKNINNKVKSEVEKIEKKYSGNEKDEQELEDIEDIINIGDRRGNEDIKDLKKEEEENIANMKKKYEMIKELLDITVRHRECFYNVASMVDSNLATPGNDEMIQSGRESVAFFEDEEQCKKLMETGEERAVYFSDYSKYNKKMQEYEEDLENYLTKYIAREATREEIEKKISEITEKAKETIEDYYSKPTAYTRFLSKMGLSQHLSFLPYESEVEEIDKRFYFCFSMTSKISLKMSCNLITSFICDKTNPWLYIVKAFIDPYINDKIDTMCCTNDNEYDPHIKSMRLADETKDDSNFISSAHLTESTINLFGVFIDKSFERFPLLEYMPLTCITDFWNAFTTSFKCCRNAHKKFSKKINICFKKMPNGIKNPETLPHFDEVC